ILRQRDAGIVALDDLARGIDARTGTQQHLDRIAANGDRLVLDALLAQAGTNVLREPLQCLIERGPDVDLIEEVHAAAKIQAETHRLEPDGSHPRRASRRARQCDDVLAGRRLADRIARPDLRIDVAETDDETILF